MCIPMGGSKPPKPKPVAAPVPTRSSSEVAAAQEAARKKRAGRAALILGGAAGDQSGAGVSKKTLGG